MNPIEHYGDEKRRINQIREKSAAERQARLNAVDLYLKERESGGMSRKELLKHYFEKYKDILDNQLTAQMKTAERYDLLKELIYKHEILREEEMGARKAA